MTAIDTRIGNMILRVQNDFLDDPTLSLTLPRSQKRFGFDRATCAGILEALVDARVLTHQEGAYRRFFPRLAEQRAA